MWPNHKYLNMKYGAHVSVCVVCVCLEAFFLINSNANVQFLVESLGAYVQNDYTKQSSHSGAFVVNEWQPKRTDNNRLARFELAIHIFFF